MYPESIVNNYRKQIIFIAAIFIVAASPSVFSDGNVEMRRSASISATAEVISPIGIVTYSEEISANPRPVSKPSELLLSHRQLFRSSVLYTGQKESNLLVMVEIDGQTIQFESNFINSVGRSIPNNKADAKIVFSLETLADLIQKEGNEYLITLITIDN